MRSGWKWIAAAAAVALVVLGALLYASPWLAVRGLRQAAQERDLDGVAARVDFPALRESLKVGLGERLNAELRKNPHDPLASIGLMFGASLTSQLVDAFITPENIVILLRGRMPDTGAAMRRALPFGLPTDFSAAGTAPVGPSSGGPSSGGPASGAMGPGASPGADPTASQSVPPGSAGTSPGAAASAPQAAAQAQQAAASADGGEEVRMGYAGLNRFILSVRGGKAMSAGGATAEKTPLVLEFRREGVFSWKLCAVRFPK